MNKTIALFIAVIAVLLVSSIYAYITVPEPIIIEEIKTEEVKSEKPAVKPTKESNTIPPRGKVENTYTKTYEYDYPFYGMEEEYVEKTRLGKADKVDIDCEVYDGGFTVITKSYIWLNSNGTYRAYAITGADIHDWDRRIVYSFTDCSKKTYYSSGKSSSKSDPYNAKDYGYADDFYDDYYDDFYDYEDAEDYWMWNQ